MDKSEFEKIRERERFNVHIRATYSIKGPDTHSHACRIANLSSSGATACFPRSDRLKKGSVIEMDISIPNTLMRVATEAEIIWTKQRFNELISGIKFKDTLSSSMIKQLTKKIP